MSHHRHLPVWKAAFDLAVHLEHAVRRFSRYHKYTLGGELRQTAQRLCRLVARANDARDAARAVALDELVGTVEEMKTFANFNEFAGVVELTVSLGKQSGGGGAGYGPKHQPSEDEARADVHCAPLLGTVRRTAAAQAGAGSPKAQARRHPPHSGGSDRRLQDRFQTPRHGADLAPNA